MKSVAWGMRVLKGSQGADRSVGALGQTLRLVAWTRSVKRGFVSSLTIWRAVAGSVRYIRTVRAVSVKRGAALTLSPVMIWDGAVKGSAVLMAYAHSRQSVNMIRVQSDQSASAVSVNPSARGRSAASPASAMMSVDHWLIAILTRRSAMRGHAFSSAREMITVSEDSSVRRSRS